jgi:hypothetical protein
MPAEAVAGRLDDLVRAIGRRAAEAPAAWGACKLAGVQGQAVEDRQLGIMRDPVQPHLPEPLLDPPQIGGLTDEGGAVHVA